MFTVRNVRSQQGFHALIGLLALVVLGVVGFAGFWVYKHGNNATGPSSGQNFGPNYKALADCGGGPVLNTLPTDLSQLDFIAPLGNVDPPDHTLPTDHMYMMYPYGTTGQRNIYAPAKVVITNVSYGEEITDGVLRTADYAMSVYPCSKLKLIFGHIDVLNEKLAAALGPNFKDSPSCQTSQQGPSQIKRCEKEVDVSLPAGDLLGTADGWDFWATMKGETSSKVTSPDYYHNADAVCPLDYFTADLKKELYAHVRSDGANKCGEAYQDKANTLQGGWFAHKDPEQAKTDWSGHLSLVHHPVETKVGLLGVGGKIADQFLYRFAPQHSGTINREPSETIAGTLYCYQHDGPERMPNGRMAGTGKTLLKLVNNHTMQAEHQDGTCSASESFTSPTTYYR